MCIGVPALAALSMGASMGSSVLGFIGQSQAASAQAAYQQSRYTAVREAAGKSFDFATLQVGKRSAQEAAVASQSSLSNTRDTNSAVGTATAAAAGSNVGGQAVADIEQQFRVIEAENEFTIRRNRDAVLDQLQASLRGDHAQAVNRINSAQPQPVQQPSLLGLGVDLLNSGLSGYMLNQQLQPPGRDR